MINLRKPLEGAPGLLLMAALILFGATLGIAFALGFSWIPMSDALANFLGGILGAGLGAVLAIGGALYVHRQESRERLTAPLNEMRVALRTLLHAVDRLKFLMLIGVPDREFPSRIGELLTAVNEAAKNLPEGSELPAAIHVLLHTTKDVLLTLLGSSRRVALGKDDIGAARGAAIQETEMASGLVRDLLSRIEAFIK
jgi:hypothetical protein